MHPSMRFDPAFRVSVGLLVLASVAVPLFLWSQSCKQEARNEPSKSENLVAAPSVDTSLVLFPVSHLDTSDWSLLSGYIDREGKQVVPFIYEYAEAFSGGLGKVTDHKTGLDGFVDGHGKLVIPCKYDYAANFCEGLASFKLKGVRGYIRVNGEEAWMKEGL
jgi:hypothetical protein